MSEPKRLMSEPQRLVETIAYEGGNGVGSDLGKGVVNVRRNRTEAETHAQMDRLIEMAGGLRGAEQNKRLASAAIRTWNALSATNRLTTPLLPYERARLVSRNNRK